MRLVQPPNTAKYEVSPSDTIARIALLYNTTPTELSRLNHLSSSLLYPGQTLFVPDKTEKETKNEGSNSLSENNISIPLNVLPKETEAVGTEMCFSPDKHLDNLLDSKALHTDDDEISRKYLKFKSKYVTDGQGVVSGVLLVTPQTVMFNPCVSDHLVMERGRDMYIVRLPLRAISKIILFEDIAAMVIGDVSQQYIPKVKFIEYTDEVNLSPKPGMIVCQETGETYALHSNLEKSTLGDATNDNYLQLALQNLTINQLQSSVFPCENLINNDENSGDQGISSGHSCSDTTVKDITMTSQTDDVPTLNSNECASCQNISEFMEDSQFSSTPKHLLLKSVNETANKDNEDTHKHLLHTSVDKKSSKDSEDNEQTICEASSSPNRCINNKLDDIESGSLSMKKKVKDNKNIVEDACDVLNTNLNSNENLRDLSNETSATTNIDICKKIVSDDISEQSKEICSNTSEEASIDKSNQTIDDSGATEKSSTSERECDNVLPERLDDSMDLIATALVENHFNKAAEDAKEDIKVMEKENCTAKDDVNTNSKMNYFEKMTSQVCDVSKDSGISEGGSTGIQDTNDSKDTINHSVLQSSLSDEARQWLGKRGVRLSSVDKEDIPVLEQNPSENEGNSADEVTPRPASHVEDPLMYVAIKVHKSYWYPINSKQSQIMGIPPNRDQKRREHWFAIPRERVDQFYNFLLYWAPDVYYSESSSGFTTPGSEGDYNDEGLEIYDDNYAHSPSASTYSPATQGGWLKLNRSDGSGVKMRRSWSMFSVSSKSSTRSLAEDEIPDLQAESQILSRKQVHLLTRKLPSRTVGHSWELIYSTTIHGISLSTLYRNFYGFDAPVLIAVKDENQKVFGAFMSEPPKISEGFYGTGESMLFTFLTDTSLKTYPWTGDNNFFIKGSKSSLVIGGGEGIFGLWLDEDLYRGRSHSCRTFSNDTLSGNEDFICCGLEAWGFV